MLMDEMCTGIYGQSIEKYTLIIRRLRYVSLFVNEKVFTVTNVLFILVKPQEIVEANNSRII